MNTGLIFLLFIACSNNKSTTNSEEAEDVSWWETEDNDASSDDKDKEDYDDEDKEDYDDEDKEDFGEFSGLTFEAEISTDDGLGHFEIEFVGEDESSCSSEHEVVEAQTHTACASCDFAWELTLDSGNPVGDSDACAELEDFNEAVLVYGHSTTLIAEYEGISYYELETYNDGDWAQEENGYSVIEGNTWYFATK